MFANIWKDFLDEAHAFARPLPTRTKGRYASVPQVEAEDTNHMFERYYMTLQYPDPRATVSHSFGKYSCLNIMDDFLQGILHLQGTGIRKSIHSPTPWAWAELTDSSGQKRPLTVQLRDHRFVYLLHNLFNVVLSLLFFRLVTSACNFSCYCQFLGRIKNRFKIRLLQAFFIKAKTKGKDVKINIHLQQCYNHGICTNNTL